MPTWVVVGIEALAALGGCTSPAERQTALEKLKRDSGLVLVCGGQ